MARRSTPERIYAARHAAVRNSLIGEGVTEEAADAWIAAWEVQAARDGLELSSAYRQRDGTGSPSSGVIAFGNSRIGA
jgi:hypothetical protein